MTNPLHEYLLQLRTALLDVSTDDGEIEPLSRLSGARADHLALAVCDRQGRVVSAGTRHAFPIQSISKAFAYGAAIDRHGLDYVLDAVDQEPTGEEFSAISIDEHTGRPKNPLVNVGALRTHAMLGADARSRAALLREVLDGAAGRELPVHEETFATERASAHRNLALAHMLRAAGSMEDEPVDVVDGYLRGCAVLVTVEDLATMGATLASGGVNPCTGRRVLSPEASQQVLSVMLTCGMYDDAGEWMSRVGLPAKSGVAGGILAVLPAICGLAAYAPALDRHGNSVRGTMAFRRMSRDYSLHLLSGELPRDVRERAEELLAAGGPTDLSEGPSSEG
ncbi:glutaminase A [Brachybacterium sp. EF45031]|uniref:glutaminase A n=1 Tax=Brachybacterium sillae TaxID=2810536 RepID=UPI00217EF71F|nr:glutaminase A [Brachybacterium sillae]MCS6711730.1 glutaminase A [Brachybacterium sillae]